MSHTLKKNTGDKHARHRHPAKSSESVQELFRVLPFLPDQHKNLTCRRLHFAGSTLTLVCLAMLVATGKPTFLLYGLLCGYGFAWVGHFGFEKNRPASFKRPLYSFIGDWAMYRDIWLGKVKV